MFGVRHGDGVLFGLAARILAHAMAGPGPFTKLQLNIQVHALDRNLGQMEKLFIPAFR